MAFVHWTTKSIESEFWWGIGVDWGKAGPNNAGSYNSMLNQAPFFEDNGYNNYESDYGKFFLGEC